MKKLYSKKITAKINLCLIVLLFPFVTFSQNDSSKFVLGGGLNELSKEKPNVSDEEKVSVASLFQTTIYEAPGIISVITAEDIKRSGYRDIMDVLNSIPGFSVATDLQNGLAFGIRGNWGNEAKLLVMIDGMALNELSYGSFEFGHRIPLNNIAKIEIIRGAGSSRYGGAAALGAINIITKTGQEVSGHKIMVSNGVSNKGFARNGLSYNYGGYLPNGVEVASNVFLNTGNMSNASYNLPDTTGVSFKDSSKITSIHYNLSLKYKGFQLKQLYDDYNFQATYEAVNSICRTSFTELSNNFEFKKVDVQVSLSHKQQLPWTTEYGFNQAYDAQNLVVGRTLAGASLKTKLAGPVQFLRGVNGDVDFMRHHRSPTLTGTDIHRQYYYGYTGYLETLISTRFAVINLGGRIEQYAYFNPAIVPRISIAKKFKYLHYKLIFNKAYKMPTLQNINLDIKQEMQPEKLDELQAQFGIHLMGLSLTGTIFNTRINNLIVFYYDQVTGNESYINSGHVYTRGTDLELSYKAEKFSITANYNHNFIYGCTTPEILVDPSNVTKGSLGLPRHKLYAALHTKLSKKASLNFQYVYETVKTGVVRVNSYTDEYNYVDFPATHNLNTIFNFDKFLSDKLNVSFGVYNVLGTKLTYIYPQSEGYQPGLGMGREFHLNLKISL